jgi:hypothetical protein
MKLEALPANRIERVDVIPSNDGNVRLLVTGEGQGTLRLRVASRIRGENNLRMFIDTRVVANGAFQHEIKGRVPGEIRLWDEFSPVLYDLAVTLGDDTGADSHHHLRLPRGAQRKRHAHPQRPPCLPARHARVRIFPLTGHPPTDVDSWKRIIRICKAHGLNHIRFHSWCPPEAAFTAADELGFYFSPKPRHGRTMGAQIGSGMPLDAWIERKPNA